MRSGCARPHAGSTGPHGQVLLRSSGRVRRMYTAYTPEDVEEIDDPPFLMFLYRNYTYPPSYPQTPEEESYLNIMSLRSWDKLCR